MTEETDWSILPSPPVCSDRQAKDWFAETARVLFLAHGATAIAVVAEACVLLPAPDGPSGYRPPPSRAPEAASQGARQLPLIRDHYCLRETPEIS